MRFDFKKERLLTVVAHPDDAELLCTGTLARAREDGAAIGVCVLCKGEKGQPSRAVPDLAKVRRKEMAASARLLGAQLFQGNISDGTLQDTPAARGTLVEVFRRFKPTLVLAHSANDYHPDHRAASALAEAATWFCASRGYPSRSPALAVPSALWWMDTIGMSDFEPEFYVDISAHLELKSQMLACHKSQLQRGTDADFSPLLELMRVQTQARGLQSGVSAAEAFRACNAFKRARAW